MGWQKVTLYGICQERVYRLLKKGTWKHCSINPFSNLPSSIVDDLMVFAEYENASISTIYPLLTSGLLTRLQLTVCELFNELDIILDIIRANCFKHLRILFLFSADNNCIPAIEALVRSCPKLEQFHTCQFFNLDILQNCKELKVFKIYDNEQMRGYKLSPENLSMLASLRNLQVLDFSESINSDMIALLLVHCPQLISLGYTDSLEGLEKVHGDIMRKFKIDYPEVSDQFQLKKCVWGKNGYTLIRMAVDDANLYKSSFPEKIRIAVSLCPFVEELLFRVSHIDSIESLKNLKHLTFLRIIFELDDNYMEKFIALLKIIGPNLKYLGVNARNPVPVNIICECCPRLEIFEIGKSATASGPVHPLYNVSLKKLNMLMIDQNALLFLLSSCKGLEELTIFDAMCLDDSLLYQILKQNPLAHLKICNITRCNLSKKGFRMFLEKAESLQIVKFAVTACDVTIVVESLIRELKLTNLHYGEMYDLHPKFGVLP